MPAIRSVISSIRRRRRLTLFVAAIAFLLVNAGAGLIARDTPPAARATDGDIEAFLREQVRDGGYPGAAFAIVREGRISHSGGIGVADRHGRPVQADTPFVIGSLSKAITATAVMQLVEAGLVDLDAPVTRYLPDFAVADRAQPGVTIRHLLHHTSGISMHAGVDPLSRPVTSLADQVAALRHVRLISEPGTAVAYSNANYLVLGLVVERVSGHPFGDYVSRGLFEPLGMDDAHSELVAAQADGLGDAHRFWFGLPQAAQPLWRPDLIPAGWLIASADDLGRFASANLNGGVIDGKRVLSPTGIQRLHEGAVSAGRGAYGMGWIDSHVGRTRVVSHSGSTTDMASALYLAPDEQMGIVLLLNGQSVVYELLHKPEAIAEAAFARMLGEPAGGTLGALYPAFTVAAIILIALQVRSIVRVVRLAREGRSSIKPIRGSVLAGMALAVWGWLVIPGLILATTPETLGAPWEILIQIDLGQVLLACALLQLTTGFVAAAALAQHRAAARRQTFVPWVTGQRIG